MKKILLYSLAFVCFSVASSAQEITEENYLKLAEELWKKYEVDMGKISECRKKYPEKRDSLIKTSDSILNLALEKNCELAIKFASVPSGLQQLFMMRLNISKDTLQAILSGLPDSLKDSPYRRNILAHIHSEQIKEGDKYYDFEAVTSEGEKFALSSLEGKNILLLYGGLDCMGKNGRAYLDSLYKKTSRHNFEIVAYCLNSSLENLKKVRNIYPCDYFLVSDFLPDHTPVKILYGAQATPTCFFINRQGIVEMKTEGLHQKRVNELVYQSK